ncbi:hypothetical protein ACG7TL_005079 [Trametes sanguinea]
MSRAAPQHSVVQWINGECMPSLLIGSGLNSAESVNDMILLACTMHLKVLHHDKSIFNILMYPVWVPHSEGPYCDSFPPLVDDALQEKLLLRSSKKRDAHCLIIDLDSPVHLRLDDAKAGSVSHELQYRTGTPACIARCVSNGALWSTESNCKWWQHKMPELSGRAKDLYVKIVPPPETDDEFMERSASIPFYHRWKYDAESVFWTMDAALLRAVPKASPTDTSRSQKGLDKA